MADSQTHSGKSFKRAAQKKVNPSIHAKRGRLKVLANIKRPRVTIGAAFQRWRLVKAQHGFTSDAEMALSLLDVMKRHSSSPASSEASDKMIKFSQSEVQTLIEQEVLSVVRKRETKLHGLIDRIRQLDHEVNYEGSMKNLQAQINTVTKRAEAAIAYLKNTNKKSPLPSANARITRADSEDETMETVSQIDKKHMDSVDKNGQLLQMMETTKRALKKMHADNKVLKDAIADLSEQQPPCDPKPCSPESKGPMKFIKKEQEDEQEIMDVVKESIKCEEPKAVKVTAECVSPDRSNTETPIHRVLVQEKLVYPPLPPTPPFPSMLSMEAASYNIPQSPEVILGLIKNPPGLSVLWKVKEEDPSSPPMDCYGIFMTMEKSKGSGVFRDWTTLGEVKAIPLPMCVLMSKYKPGHKVCVAVIGKDKFGRYGPYSEVATAAIPD